MTQFLCGELADNHSKGFESSFNPLPCLKAEWVWPNIVLLDTCLSSSDWIFMIAWVFIALLSSPLKKTVPVSRWSSLFAPLLTQSSGERVKGSSVGLPHSAHVKGAEPWLSLYFQRDLKITSDWWSATAQAGNWQPEEQFGSRVALVDSRLAMS